MTPETRHALLDARRFLDQLAGMYIKGIETSDYKRGVADFADGFAAYLDVMAEDDVRDPDDSEMAA